MKKMGKWVTSLLLIISLTVPTFASELMGVQASEVVVMEVQDSEKTDQSETETETETETEVETETETESETETETETESETEIETETPAEQIKAITNAGAVLTSAQCRRFGEIEVQWEAAGDAKADGYFVYRKADGEKSWVRQTITDQTSYKDEDVTYGVQYTYTVRPYKVIEGKTYLGQYDRTGITTDACPKAPVIATEKVSPTKVQLTWNETEGADLYRVYVKDTNGKWKRIATVETTTYTATVVCGARTVYTVRAYKKTDSGEQAGYYDKAGATVQTVPDTPYVREATSAGATSAVISWDAAEGATSYRIYRKGSDDKSYTYLATTSKLTYTDTGLTCGKSYTYTLKASVVSEGKRYDSDYDRKGMSVIPMPAMPTIKTAKSAGYDSVTLSWEAVEGATAYRVYRKASDEQKYTLAGVTSKLTYTDTGLTCGKSYTYTLKASVVSEGKRYDSDYDRKGMSVTPIPATPVLNAISGSDYENINVTWSAVSGADGYLVYRKEKGGSWERIATISNSSRNYYADITADGDKVYIYTVRAFKDVDGKRFLSDYDRTGTYWIDYPILLAPSSDGINNGITVGWDAIDGVDGYYVYRKTNGGSWSRIADIKQGGERTYSYFDSKTAKNTYYLYTVRAYCKAGKQMILGAYDRSGRGTADLTITTKVAWTYDSQGRVKTFKVTLKNNTSKPIYFYDDALVMAEGTSADYRRMQMTDVGSGAKYNGFTTDTAYIGSNTSGYIEYTIVNASSTFKKGKNILFFGAIKYDGHEYCIYAEQGLDVECLIIDRTSE